MVGESRNHHKSFKDEPAAHWTCDGSPEFTLEPADKPLVVLKSFAYCRRFTGVLEDSKKGLLNKYNKFMPIPIKFGTKTEKLNKKKGRSC
jgi:molecular chaperone HtpG